MVPAQSRQASEVVNTAKERSRPTVAVIADSASDENGEKVGVGRYVRALRTGIGQAGFDIVGSTPALPSLPSLAYRILRFLRRYNYPIWSSYPKADIYHLTTQELGSLLVLHRPKGPVVVTVHDIFPYMLRHHPELLSFLPGDRLYVHVAMAGLKRADHLITVSEHSKRCVVEHLGIAEHRITTIHEGVDRDRFRALQVPAAIRERYGLPEGRRYLLYVGTEDRRKNLVVLVRGLAKLRRRLPDVELVKVGRPHRSRERPRLLELATELGIGQAIHFLDEVPEDDLPLLYNLADVYVTASPYEGFGLPVLEAMASGTPVVCAKAASHVEIAGEAALRVPPGDVDTFADTVRSLLESREQQSLLRRSGQEQAARFTWAATIRNTADVYRQLIEAKADVVSYSPRTNTVDGRRCR
jgi:glycosyltransferase involved in cell wall biosynthesis